MDTSSRLSAYSEYTIKWATQDWEVEQAYALRRRVFCDEQTLFEHDDRDVTDQSAQLLVALGGYGGWHEQVVGTVRIHATGPDTWHGSRLAVDPGFRNCGHLGSTLIKLAVSSAHALGCRRFFARVQSQNEALFRHLHWDRLGEETVCGRAHVVMEANLDYYPPCHDPVSGFVVRGYTPDYIDDIAPGLLELVTTQAPAVATERSTW
ncbi:MSMEG_0567/Sll0786 family nitrogen starvation N-acetyltransferase [Marinobacter sp. F3R08]|uniref:MSMEG_0567/Sll0786 family nitrogen starvation N-acetyltransferase n=1 Tax=Marinobacter sp. F3R08 TaxID=2841559 RepID=UPI001C09450E|nr:MSMEG_0567/Sll0786 family nitrogen starvation N-acetyltransferase [Marinobacter sp. F3R08]MBU2954760.1 GNAT family N-acetyltransferase [Marinobacter sp. F3R08]